MARFKASFRSSTNRFNATLRRTADRFDAAFRSVQVVVDVDDYTGPYAFTPSATTQIVPTSRLLMIDNVTINPIPNNYGLITWNGSTLTVS